MHMIVCHVYLVTSASLLHGLHEHCAFQSWLVNYCDVYSGHLHSLIWQLLTRIILHHWLADCQVLFAQQ